MTGSLYLWLMAFHIIAMVAWFAGLFYLPMLFFYHASAADAVSRERFIVMERKLYRVIMRPAMIATLIFGVWLLGVVGVRHSGVAMAEAHRSGGTAGLSPLLWPSDSSIRGGGEHPQRKVLPGVQ